MSITITAVYILLCSYHTVCGPDCNQNNNPPIGLDFRYRGSNYTVVSYPNTHSNMSVVLAKREKYYFYGLVTGYADVPLPFIAPIVTAGPLDVSCLSDFAELRGGDKTNTVCTASVKYRF